MLISASSVLFSALGASCLGINMKLKRLLLRYYPPGIILQYLHNNGELEDKTIDLLNLTLE